MSVKPFESSGSTSSRMPGMYITTPSSTLKVYNVSYEKGSTVFRPYPVFINGVEQRWRDAEGNFGTSFIVRDEVCQGWGVDSRITCFLQCSDAENWPQGSPLQLFYSDMRANKKRFGYLFERVKGSFPPISKPRLLHFVQCVLLKHNGKSLVKNPVWGVMLTLSPSAGDAFIGLLNQRVPDGLAPVDPCSADPKRDPYGWNSKYVVGDPISCEEGKVFELDKESKIKEVEEAPVEIDLNGVSTVRSAQDKAEIENYACRIYPKARCLKLPVDRISKISRQFETDLLYLTGTDQIRQVLEPAYRSEREALLFTFGGKGLLSPAFERGQVVVPVAKPKQQAPVKPQMVVEDDDSFSPDALLNAPEQEETSSPVMDALTEELGDGSPADYAGEEILEQRVSDVPKSVTQAVRETVEAPVPAQAPAVTPTTLSLKERLLQAKKAQQNTQPPAAQ